MEDKIKLAKLDMLVILGVDINAKKKGKSALIWAKEAKNEKVIENSNKNSNQDIGNKKKDSQINKDNQPDNKNDETKKYKNKNNDKGE